MKKLREWQILFILCCLIYFGWMISISGFEFGRIHNQYNRIVAKLDPEEIKDKAIKELVRDCLKRQSQQYSDQIEGACSSWQPSDLEAKEQEITNSIKSRKKRAAVKVFLFYTVFVGFFLLTPLALAYLLIIGVIKLFTGIKIIK